MGFVSCAVFVTAGVTVAASAGGCVSSSFIFCRKASRALAMVSESTGVGAARVAWGAVWTAGAGTGVGCTTVGGACTMGAGAGVGGGAGCATTGGAGTAGAGAGAGATAAGIGWTAGTGCAGIVGAGRGWGFIFGHFCRTR